MSTRTSASAGPPTRSDVQSRERLVERPRARAESAASSRASVGINVQGSLRRSPGTRVARRADVAGAHEEDEVARARELAQARHDRRLLGHELDGAVAAGAHRLGQRRAGDAGELRPRPRRRSRSAPARRRRGRRAPARRRRRACACSGAAGRRPRSRRSRPSRAAASAARIFAGWWRVVVDHGHAVALAHDLEAALDAAELGERRARCASTGTSNSSPTVSAASAFGTLCAAGHAQRERRRAAWPCARTAKRMPSPAASTRSAGDVGLRREAVGPERGA